MPRTKQTGSERRMRSGAQVRRRENERMAPPTGEGPDPDLIPAPIVDENRRGDFGDSPWVDDEE